MIKLAIFDLDGTLLNTIRDLGEACNHALQQHGYPTHTPEEYPHFVGNGVNKLLWRALPEPARTDEEVLLLRRDFVDYYDRHNRVFTRPYDGIPEVLQTLHERGILLAVASNKYHAATEALVRHYFGDIFSEIRGEQPPVPRKPEPDIVRLIINNLAANNQPLLNEEILYIGDSDVDVLTARNAGLTSVACTWGFCATETLRDLHPDHLINTPQEILNLC